MIETIATTIGTSIGAAAKSYALNKFFDVIWKKITPGNDIEKAVDTAFNKSMKEVFPDKDYRCIMTDEFKRDFEQMIISPSTWQSEENDEHNRVYTLFMQYLSESDPFAFSYVMELKAQARYNVVEQQLLQITSSQNVSVEFIENLITQAVDPFIEELKTKSALRIINEIENNCSTLLEKNNAIYSKLLIYKGHCLQFTNLSETCNCYDRAFELNPGYQKTIEMKIISLLARGQKKEAQNISYKLPDNNRYKILCNILTSDNISDAYTNAPDELRSDLGFRYQIAERISDTGVDNSFLYDECIDYSLQIPSNLLYSNLLVWSFIIGFYRTLDAKRGVRFYRELYRDISQQGIMVAEQFSALLEKTEVRESYNVVFLLYYYWKFMKEDGKQWIELFHQDLHTYLKNRDNVFLLLEANMLQIDGRYEEAFTVITSSQLDDSTAVFCFMCVMCSKSSNMDYLKWALENMKTKQISLDDTCCRFMALLLNNELSKELKTIIKESTFEHDISKDIILSLIGIYDGKSIQRIKEQVSDIPEEVIPYAAIVLSKNNEKEFAFDILNAKVDKGVNDFRRYTFLKILSENPLHYKELYEILKENRAAREINDFTLLSKEYELANTLLDYENAFDVVSILYQQNPDNESCFVNYIVSLQHINSQITESLKEKVLHFDYQNDNSIRYIYQAFSSAGLIDYAVEFLYQQTVNSNSEYLRNLYQIESVQGFVKTAAHVECDEVLDGCCVDFFANGEKKREVITSDSDYRFLIGFKKGDEIKVKRDNTDVNIKIEHIWNKYFALSSDIFKDIMSSGGNSVFKPLQIDMEHPLESLEKELERIDPEAKNRQQQYINAIAAYEMGTEGLCQLVNDDDLLGDYYSKLFGTFKIYSPPCTEQLFKTQGMNFSQFRFVLELTSLITLFEYSAKYNITFKLDDKFLIPKSVRELVVNNISQCECIRFTNIFDIHNNKSVQRYSNDPKADVKLRLEALLAWIDTNCDVVMVDTSLTINDPNQRLTSRVLLDTLSLLMNGKAVLVTEDSFLEQFLQMRIPTLNAEACIQGCAGTKERQRLSRFLAKSNFIGVTVDSDFVVEQYRKYQEKEQNVYQNILLTMSRNPFMFTVAINASLVLADTPIITTQLTVTFTNMFAMAMKPLPQDFFDSTWSQTEKYFDLMPSTASKIVKECLNNARTIVGK